ncbi:MULTISPECIES: type VI secretion system contractile sheath domain-containing protein [unclassified Microbulbifer]|uniref:type VI secretion system contractile sheath domain-containing protein n=1 Tax=unclassified Microbulbifer TaxID=2619833 RepID=UPI0027E5193D|nr:MULTISPECIES: type VI secretion system contractile sheath large subunit [unclassified Microbulbifer]
MNQITMNSGASIFHSEQGAALQPTSGEVLKVAILGDFSGRSSRRLCEPETLSQRPAHRLGKDSFESLFERLGVRMQLPVMDEPLSLLEYDDLHPDYLYSRVPLFRQFIELEKRLLNPAEFSRAAEEIQQWKPELRGVNDALANASLGGASMLDAILGSDSYRDSYRNSDQGRIDRLIRDIVAPYVQKTPDQRQGTYLQAVKEAASEAMRKLMHHSDFRQLEASWRSLHLLLRRVQDHPNLHLYLIDISKEELMADLAQAESDLEKSQVFKCLVERETISGSRPYNVIVGDFFVTDEERDLHWLIDLSTIAEAAGSALLLGADPRLAGCPSLAGSLDPDDWHYPLSGEFAESWLAVREYSGSEYVALAGPRFMLRLPYGADSATTDCFEYEELTPEHGHNYYLWGNSAYLLALSICQQFSEAGRPAPVLSASYEDLPLHLRDLPQGRWMTPCAEALLTDRAAARFESAGISTLRSVQGRDQILLPRLQSLAGGGLKGPWS